MFCDVCQTKEATVFLTQIVEGKMQKVNLCEGCSKEKGVNDPTGFALADLLLGLGAAQEIEKNPAGVRCPVCGFSQADFKKTGRLGCSACYDAFSEGLSGMLKNMHRGTVHVGKVPRRLAVARRRSRELAGLQADLEKAVAGEQFEEAAGIRDRILSIEAEIKAEAMKLESGAEGGPASANRLPRDPAEGEPASVRKTPGKKT
jgi:protein arginine kinase activator